MRGEQDAMADPAPATENNEARRIQMLRAAAKLICERGFSDTRIADVAKRAGVSSALVIYYFGTRDRLLVDALRFSEESFYTTAQNMLAEVGSLRDRLSLLIRWTCVPEGEGDDEIPGAWGLWFDLWAQAFRHDEVKAGRIEADARWRRMIVDALESADSAELKPTVDAKMFALEFAASIRRQEPLWALPPPAGAESQDRLSAFSGSTTGSSTTTAVLRVSTRTASWVHTQCTGLPGPKPTDRGPA